MARGFGVSGFFREAEYLVDEACFEYLGVRIAGNGFMTWTPGKGYHLELVSIRGVDKLPSRIVFGSPKVVTRKDRTFIRMKLRDQGWAITPRLTMDDPLGYKVVTEHRLSVDLPGVCFLALPAPHAHEKLWSGSSLLDVGGPVHWPDAITQTTVLDGHTIQEGFSRSGLSYRGPTMTLVGRYEEGRHLDLHWSLEKSQYSKADRWRFPEALKDAFRVMLTRSVHLLERQADSPQRRLERRSPFKVQSAGPFLLFDDEIPLDKERLLTLTAFFLKEGPEARIARKIVSQLIRAWRQSTWSDTQLLVSTILEATLRACDGSPWNDKSWDMSDSMTRFRERYLSLSWRLACGRAADLFRRLRHPTAHPDWRFDDHDPALDSMRAQSFGEMTFLSHFYGYLILAMAGVQGLDPIFGGRRLDQVRDKPQADPTPTADHGSQAMRRARRHAP